MHVQSIHVGILGHASRSVIGWGPVGGKLSTNVGDAQERSKCRGTKDVWARAAAGKKVQPQWLEARPGDLQGRCVLILLCDSEIGCQAGGWHARVRAWVAVESGLGFTWPATASKDVDHHSFRGRIRLRGGDVAPLRKARSSVVYMKISIR